MQVLDKTGNDGYLKLAKRAWAGPGHALMLPQIGTKPKLSSLRLSSSDAIFSERERSPHGRFWWIALTQNGGFWARVRRSMEQPKKVYLLAPSRHFTAWVCEYYFSASIWKTRRKRKEERGRNEFIAPNWTRASPCQSVRRLSRMLQRSKRCL